MASGAVHPHNGGIFVQAMVQNGIKEVPSRFLQQKSGVPELFYEELSVPVIDMSKLLADDSSELDKLATACREWGFFQIVNHTVPISLLEGAREAARRFFQLPHEEKLKYAMKPGSCEGYGRHFLVSEEVLLDWVDLLYHQLQPLSSRDISAWPNNPPAYRVVIDKYAHEVQQLVKVLLGKISETLRVYTSFLEDKFGQGDHTQTLRVNYYPPCPQPDLVMGLSPHSDPGGITVLLQDDVEGLQVRKNGNWVQVRADPQAFVVNIADQIEIITNGAYKSVEHRVVVKSESKERISLAMFHSPCENTLISSATEFIRSNQPSMYSSMTFGEYKSSFLNKELKGKSHVEALIIKNKQE